MIVIILNVTWSVYIYYSTLNTFLPTRKRNEIDNENRKRTHTHTHSKLPLLNCAFHIQIRMIASGFGVCARSPIAAMCVGFDSVLFHAECSVHYNESGSPFFLFCSVNVLVSFLPFVSSFFVSLFALFLSCAQITNTSFIYLFNIYFTLIFYQLCNIRNRLNLSMIWMLHRHLL